MSKKPPSQLTSWVREEVRALCPRWFSSLFLGALQALPLVFSRDVKQIQIKARKVYAPTSILTDVAAPSDLRSPTPTHVDVELPQNRFLTRQISAPAKAAGQLRAIAGLDLARRAPFKPGEVVWTLSLPRREGEMLFATQWVLHRDDLQKLENRLISAGLTPRNIRVEGLPEVVSAVANLATRKSQKANIWLLANGIIASATLLAAVVSWVLPALHDARALNPELASLEAARAEALALRQEVETLRSAADERSSFLHDIVYRPKLSETLRDVTIALPDSVWLSDLSFNQSGVVFTGEAAGSAADLVIALASVRDFSNPRLSGAVSRSTSGGEQFELSIDHKAMP